MRYKHEDITHGTDCSSVLTEVIGVHVLHQRCLAIATLMTDFADDDSLHLSCSPTSSQPSNPLPRPLCEPKITKVLKHWHQHTIRPYYSTSLAAHGLRYISARQIRSANKFHHLPAVRENTSHYFPCFVSLSNCISIEPSIFFVFR